MARSYTGAMGTPSRAPRGAHESGSEPRSGNAGALTRRRLLLRSRLNLDRPAAAKSGTAILPLHPKTAAAAVAAAAAAAAAAASSWRAPCGTSHETDENDDDDDDDDDNCAPPFPRHLPLLFFFVSLLPIIFVLDS